MTGAPRRADPPVLDRREAGSQLLAEHPNERVRLQAINSLDQLGDLAAPAIDTIEAARTDPDNYVGWAAGYAAEALQPSGAA